MPETTHESLGGVAETLLIPLYIRAVESQRSDAILRDEKAVAPLHAPWRGVAQADERGYKAPTEMALTAVRRKGGNSGE